MDSQALPETFGSWLKHRRRTLDLTQEQLADCAGCSVVTIRKFESDERRPSKQLAELLSNCLQVPKDEQENFIQFARRPPSFEPTPLTLSPVFEKLPSLPTPPPAHFTPFPATRAVSPTYHLPAPLTSLIGREDDIATLTELLTTTRLLTLTGPGGTGKTRLALETARRVQQTTPTQFPDGIIFIELAAVTDPASVLSEISKALGVKEGVQAILDALITWLQPRKTLLILDNFEQILQAAPELLPLLLGAPGLHLLVTSRAVLHLYGEQEYPVPPLPFPQEKLPPLDPESYPAIHLFVERARAVKPGFALSSETATIVAEICARLDGLPLAIELAAARSKLYAPAALLAELEHGLDFLVVQNRSITDRQRTLRNAIEWSFNLLEKETQIFFAQLGVFSGEFDLDAVLSVFRHSQTFAWNEKAPGTEHWTLVTLQALADHSMIQLLERSNANAPPRFRLLQTLREYALEQLGKVTERESVQEQHALYYLSLAEQSREHFRGEDILIWLERMDEAYDNLRAALIWSLSMRSQLPIAQRLGLAMVQYWMIRGYLTEGRGWLNEIISQSEIAPPETYASLLDASGELAEIQRDFSQARACFEQAQKIWHRIEEPERIEKNLLNLGRLEWRLEHFDIAQTLIEETLFLARDLEDDEGVSTSLNMLGNIAHYRGDLKPARKHFEESLAIAQRIGNQILEGIARTNLGSILQVQGNYALAKTHFEGALSVFRKLGFKERMAGLLGNLGNTGLKINDLDLAERAYWECLEIRQEMGLHRVADHPLHGLGIVANRRGDRHSALAFLSESLAIQSDSGKVRGLPSLIETIGNIALESGLPEQAVILYGAMDALSKQKITAVRSPYGQENYDQRIAEMQKHLTSEVFNEMWKTGSAMSLEDAITLARNLSRVDSTPTELEAEKNMSTVRYVQEELLARGGMGEVYRGRDTTSGQIVAIKKLKADLIANDPEMVARFVREGELLRQLNHPNIVKMFAAQRENGHYQIVMEYVPGGTLRKLLDDQPQLPVPEALNIALELADALARAHHIHVLHRDLKPENVLLAADGTPRLTDFGIAYKPHSETRLTQPGTVLGTTSYLSPEACMGEELDVRSDIWSFGVMLFEMLAGHTPFGAENIMATLVNILTRPIPNIQQSRKDTPAPVVSLLGKMLVKERSHRIHSMRQIAAELEQVRDAV